MTNPYKLTKEIEQFIIEQKRLNPKLSCRGLIPLVREHFQVSLSKSLINKVIKQNDLSSPVGRRGLREPEQKAFVPQPKKSKGFIENGGCFLLKAADFKIALTAGLVGNLSVYFPNLTQQALQALIEATVFLPLFQNKKDLWLFIGKEIPSGSLEQYSAQLSQIPVYELNKVIIKSGFNHKINNFNDLHEACLKKLNSYVQDNFFPSAYQFLDFAAMQERFYSLWAKIEQNAQFLKIQFFYPKEFLWKNDLVWQEDLVYAANRVNELCILAQEKEQIWINPQTEILPPF